MRDVSYKSANQKRLLICKFVLINEMHKLSAINVTKKSGREEFSRNGAPLSINLLDFWQWSSSDLVGNTLRGLIAEFIVLSAVGCEQDTRIEWDAIDILSPKGIKIEVKSSAYIQSWQQKEYSKLIFKIPPTKGWDATTNTSSLIRMRQSDVYVFCVLTHKEKETIDPMNLDQWEFYIIATETLNKLVGTQKTIRLSSLKKLGPIKVLYENIDAAIKRVLNTSD